MCTVCETFSGGAPLRRSAPPLGAFPAPLPLVSCPPWSRLSPRSQAELWTTFREPDSCLMVSLRAPRELERYVFSPGGRSDSRDHDGGEEGLPEEDGWEGPEEDWGEGPEEDGGEGPEERSP